MASVPLEDRRTIVMAAHVVPTIRVCIQSPAESDTGARLAGYSDAEWWRRQIDRFTDLAWRGDIRIDACRGKPMRGWVHVRAGEEGEVREGTIAHAKSWRPFGPHGIRVGWIGSEIVWNPDGVNILTEHHFEEVLAHELGHVLGFGHTPEGSGFVMVGLGWASHPWPDRERWMTQWAYAIGPNVRYPGFVRPPARAPGDVRGGVKDLADESLDDLQDDADGRQATESVPALPTAGTLVLAVLLGLSGRRPLHNRNPAAVTRIVAPQAVPALHRVPCRDRIASPEDRSTPDTGSRFTS